jgi:hypothetical protein
MPSLILPCTFDELPRDIKSFLLKGTYRRKSDHAKNRFPLDFNGNPFDKILFPLELLIKPEYRDFIKETRCKSLEHLQKWHHTAWQDNERQLDSVPNGYRENGMLRFRGNERQYNKQAEEIRQEIDIFFSGKRERTQEIRDFLSKKENLQKEWFDNFLRNYHRIYAAKYHTDIITL